MTLRLSLAFSLAVVATASAQHRTYLGPTFSPSAYDGYSTNGRYFPGSGEADRYANNTAGLFNGYLYAAGQGRGERGLLLTSTGFSYRNPLQVNSTGYGNAKIAAINNAGTIVGSSTKLLNGDYAGTLAVRWNAGSTTPVSLGSLGTGSSGTQQSWTTAINASGAIAGSSVRYINGDHAGQRAVRWNAGSTTPIELQMPDNSRTDLSGTATGINDSGTVIGYGDRLSGGVRRGYSAYRWNANSPTPIELGSLGTGTDGYAYSSPTAINAAGTIVGSSEKYVDGVRAYSRPVRWDANSQTAIELSVPSRPAAFGASANDINTAGTIVGNIADFQNSRSVNRALKWNAGSTAYKELSNLAAGDTLESYVYDINDSGVSIGYSDVSDGKHHAVLWRKDGSVVDLNQYGGTAKRVFSQALSISNTGYISGVAAEDTSVGASEGSSPIYGRAFLILVPEAGTYGRGDANFDGVVNVSDLLILAVNYNKPTNGSVNVADFNLDGQTNVSDLLQLAVNYNTTPGELASLNASEAFESDWARIQNTVPEPATLGLLLSAATLLLRRRNP